MKKVAFFPQSFVQTIVQTIAVDFFFTRILNSPKKWPSCPRETNDN